MGHSIKILTSHHDPNHCFEETKREGKLGKYVHVYGDWLPRHIFGKCTALCAIIRMIYLTIVVIISNIFGIITFNWNNNSELVFMDGVSASIPLFCLINLPVMFYCHFPDKLLCVERVSIFKQLYRKVIDSIEEITTGCSSFIVVNSKFTGLNFKNAFPFLGKECIPSVLYPTIETDDNKIDQIIRKPGYLDNYDHIYVSLNRYERKKNIRLAIDSFSLLKKKIQTNNKNKPKLLLVIAGGYDHRVDENVDYLVELCNHAKSLGLVYNQPIKSQPCYVESNTVDSPDTIDIIFRTSISNEERQILLASSCGLLYTPSNEHFGIVPLEAMYSSIPVIAVSSGGPLETVISGETGYLCEQTPLEFSNAMYNIIQPVVNKDKSKCIVANNMGIKGKQHVIDNFTMESIKGKLQQYIDTARKGGSEKDLNRVRKYVILLLFFITFSLYHLFTVIKGFKKIHDIYKL
jgi:alpha-1,3/alpha-1,6-mannosyltransferase